MSSQLRDNLPSAAEALPQPKMDRASFAKAWAAIRRFITAPVRFSLAGKAALLLFLFLAGLVSIVWLVLHRDPNVVIWQSYMSANRMALVVALVILTPLVVYYTLRLWLEGEKSQFPDIDYAWKAGLEALRANGVPLRSTPIFLIHGSTHERQEKALLAAAGLRLRVEGTPEGPAALHWYANPDGIFVFCTEASVLSAFNANRQKKPRESGEVDTFSPYPEPAYAAPQAPAAPAHPSARTPLPNAAPARGSSGNQPAGQPTGTIMLDQFVEMNPTAAGAPEATGADDPAALRGTLVLSPTGEPVAPARPPTERRDRTPEPRSVPSHLGSPRFGETGVDVHATVSAQQSIEQLQRLQYVCQLLQRARQPLCPINGVLTLLPFEAVQASPSEVRELESAIKSDLTTVQRHLRLRSPVSALVVGLEQERGFRELVRRVGRDRAATQRFGRKFDVRALATPDEMRNLSAHVSGAFEDWIYTLFREQGALSRPGNTRLYSLLCKVRCTVKPRLSAVLSAGFGYDARLMPNDDPIPFSGCYFAATGETPDRQAFVRGVIDKLIDEQEQLEWTSAALRGEQRYRRLVTLGIVTNVVLLISIAALFVLSRS